MIATTAGPAASESSERNTTGAKHPHPAVAPDVLTYAGVGQKPRRCACGECRVCKDYAKDARHRERMKRDDAELDAKAAEWLQQFRRKDNMKLLIAILALAAGAWAQQIIPPPLPGLTQDASGIHSSVPVSIDNTVTALGMCTQVLNYIPANLRGSVMDGSITTDVAAYVQAAEDAAVATNGSVQNRCVVYSAGLYPLTTRVTRGGSRIVCVGTAATGGCQFKAIGTHWGDGDNAHNGMIVSTSTVQWEQNNSVVNNYDENSIYDGIRLNCNSLAPRALVITNMGEQSEVRNVETDHCLTAEIEGRGLHAPFTLRYSSTFAGSAYGISFVNNGGTDGGGGLVRLNGLSGDLNATAHVYISGAQVVMLDEMKSEGHAVEVLVNGTGTGGSSAQVVVNGGYFQSVNGVDVVKITGTATPAVSFYGPKISGTYTNWINDTVASKTLPAGSSFFSFNPTVISYNAENYTSQTTLNALGALYAVSPNGAARYKILGYESDQRYALRVPSPAFNGMRIYDSSGADAFDLTTGGLTITNAIKGSSLQDSVVLVSALGTCNSGAQGTFKSVSDANSPTAGGTIAGSGSVFRPVVCNGTNWVSLY